MCHNVKEKRKPLKTHRVNFQCVLNVTHKGTYIFRFANTIRYYFRDHTRKSTDNFYRNWSLIARNLLGKKLGPRRSISISVGLIVNIYIQSIRWWKNYDGLICARQERVSSNWNRFRIDSRLGVVKRSERARSNGDTNASKLPGADFNICI